jgi:hypothetical protein
MHDSLLTRIRLERLLSSVDWRPTSLPVNSILCIRKAHDPLPNSFSLSASSLQPAYEWQQALTSMLNRFASLAVRPLTKLVSPDSEAVLFLDGAELLACLAVDWRRGSLTTNWWWRGILSDRDLAAVVKLWTSKSQYVPAALQHLAMISVAVSFVGQLPDTTCRQLIHTVAHSFGATALLPLLDVAVARKALNESDSSTDLDGLLPATKTRDTEVEHPPWRAFVPETDSSLLSYEQQRFLGVGLMIYRASSQARSRDFARGLARWQSSINKEDRNYSTRSHAKTSSSQAVSRPAERGKVPIEFSATSADQLIAQRREEGHGFPKLLAREAMHEHVEKHPATELTAIPPPQPESVSSPSELRRDISDSSPDVAAVLPESEPEPSITLDLEHFERPVIEFDTKLGGLFYLINLSMYLNLYSDFTSPLAPGIELNIWDFVALVGSELLEGIQSDDPIWAALANLSGRDEAEPPGENFEPESEWRLPPEWLLPFAVDQLCKWETSRDRLRVLHPEGFLLLDLFAGPDVRAQLQREIEPYGISSDALTRAQLPNLALLHSKDLRRRSLGHWLSLLMPYVRVRLRVALGLKANDETLPILCRHYARVRATDTHVDIYFGLADLPLAIRFAGLDRDPGWVPAAGRFISFHFD